MSVVGIPLGIAGVIVAKSGADTRSKHPKAMAVWERSRDETLRASGATRRTDPRVVSRSCENIAQAEPCPSCWMGGCAMGNGAGVLRGCGDYPWWSLPIVGSESQCPGRDSPWSVTTAAVLRDWK